MQWASKYFLIKLNVYSRVKCKKNALCVEMLSSKTLQQQQISSWVLESYLRQNQLAAKRHGTTFLLKCI